MASTLNKNSSATILTFNNFRNLIVKATTPADAIGDITADDDDAILIKVLGPQMTIEFDWTLMAEASSVVSGTGSPVTTAVGQFLYLYNTLKSQGTDQITDTYTLTLDFGGGNTLVKTGVITELTTTMEETTPVTYTGHLAFLAGTVA